MPALPYPYPDPITGTMETGALLSNLNYLMSLLTAQHGNLVPSGSILIFRSGSTCPAGYSLVTDANLAGRYLRVNLAAAGATGGSLTVGITDPGHMHGVGTYTVQPAGTHTHVLTTSGGHTHTASIPTSTRSVTSAAIGTPVIVASSTHLHTLTTAGAHTHVVSAAGLHTHAVTGLSAIATTGITGTIAPTFLDIILCQKS